MKVGTVRFVSFFVILFLAAPFVTAQSDDNSDLVRGLVEAINSRDMDALDEIVASSVRRHCAATPGVVVENLDQFKEFLRQDFAAVPDSQQEIDVLFSTDKFAAARVIYRGTQKGAWGPFPASNKELEIPFISILRVEEGKIAEIWVEWDNLNALQQLGHLDLPESGARAEPETDGVATLLSGEQPSYTPDALRTRIQGDVVLEVLISEQGQVLDVKVVRALPMGLTEAAVESVRRWKFEPARRDGEPIRETKEIRIPFRLPDGDK